MLDRSDDTKHTPCRLIHYLPFTIISSFSSKNFVNVQNKFIIEFQCIYIN